MLEAPVVRAGKPAGRGFKGHDIKRAKISRAHRRTTFRVSLS
jgi:hypothetical protein